MIRVLGDMEGYKLFLQLIFCDLETINFYVTSFVMNIRLHQQDDKGLSRPFVLP